MKTIGWKAKLFIIAVLVEAVVFALARQNPHAEIWSMPVSYQAGSILGETVLWWAFMLVPAWIYRKLKGRKAKSEQE